MLDLYNIKRSMNKSKNVLLGEYDESLGMFKYGEGPIVDNDPAKYNVTRHIGLHWMLHEVFNTYISDPYTKIRLMSNGANSYVIEDKIRKKPRVLAGTQALFIMAYPRHDEAFNVLKFMLDLQLPNGDFIHKLDANLYPTTFRSSFYTGEVLLALSHMIPIIGLGGEADARLRNDIFVAVQRSFDYLNAINYGVSFKSHWMYYFLTEFLQFDCGKTNEALDYLQRLIHETLNNPSHRKEDYVAPVACQVESLMRSLLVLRKHHSSKITDFNVLENRVIKFVEQDIEYILACFDGRHFCKGARDTQWRMDYAQHINFALHYYLEYVS